MSRRELKRLSVLERAIHGEITIRQAAELLKLSERQVKRLKGRVRLAGPPGVVHGNRTRAPKHKVPQPVRRAIVSLATGDYHGASFNHMAELLHERDGIDVSPKTVGRILKQADISSPYTHKAARRRRSRVRMPREGDLVQIDASPHAWLEGRGEEMHLHGAIDDATGKVLALFFRPTEDIRGYQELFTRMILTHGVPLNVYSDGHAMFFPKDKDKDKLTVDEELEGKKVSITQIGMMLESLDIHHIHARSPQAKGRVERLWETLQGRLSIELRIAGVVSLEQANAFLPGFIEKHNRNFAVKPALPEPSFRPSPTPEALSSALALRESRVASRGSTIRFQHQDYQLLERADKVALLNPGSKVWVLTHLDGSLSARIDDRSYQLRVFTSVPAAQKERPLAAPARINVGTPAKATKSPWRTFNITDRKPDPVEAYFSHKDFRWVNVFAQR